LLETLSRNPSTWSCIRKASENEFLIFLYIKKGQELAAQQQFEKAFACFKRGIEVTPRHSELLCHLADAYHMGQGVQEDDVKALALYRQAAEEGNVEGLLCTGWHHAGAYGVPPDNVEAAKWWRIAAEQGNAEAQFLLAASYEDGLGVPKDLEAAVHWYRKAAEQGEEPSRQALHRILSKIEGAEREGTKKLDGNSM
jgi:TPR repeat protein